MKIKKKIQPDTFVVCERYSNLSFKEYHDKIHNYTRNQIRNIYKEVFGRPCTCSIVWAKYQISYELARQMEIKNGCLERLAKGSEFRKAYEGTMRCDLSSTGETLKTLIPFEMNHYDENSQENIMKKENKIKAIKKAAAAKAALPNTDEASVTKDIVALVAEKTGYPEGMLDLDLDMEADLGIDTVKQAELFAIMREKYQIARQEGVQLKDYPTIRSIIKYAMAHAGTEGAATVAAAPAAAQAPAAVTSAPAPAPAAVQPAPVAAAPKAANRVGITLKKSVPETWVHVFKSNAKNKWTDEKISEFMHQEFPDLKNKAFDQVKGCRNHYNNGGYTKGEKPAVRAVGYDAEGNVIGRAAKKAAPAPKKAESKAETTKSAPAKKVKVTLKAKRPAVKAAVNKTVEVVKA